MDEDRNEIGSEDAGLARLRASRDEIEGRDHTFGVERGKTWARKSAAYDELRRVASIDDAALNYEDTDFGGARYLVMALMADDKPSVRDHAEWIDRLFGHKSPTLAEISGFIDGAREMFDKV